jgi:para-aminobenzoate synthetase/4-amino-4-deoxychorismate lyase
VRVPRLLEVERYRTVWQMTSTVTGTLRGDVGLLDLFRALFPCGSVTGAPKISTMGVIARLEASPREVYCGAIGWAGPDGCAFNVPIRTLWLDRETGRAEYGAGGGVVWESAAADEYDELLAKAAVLREPWAEFELLETLRLEDGRCVRVERHLARMAASADYFGFRFPGDDVRRRLEDLAAALPAGPHRARVLLDSDGAAQVEAAPLPEAPSSPEVVLAAAPVSSADRFLYHKTTNRAALDARRAGARDAFDVLLRNERDELTEFTRGTLVLELDGRKVTPALACGLLPGCLRAELIEKGEVAETVIPVSALARATRVWFVNSLRGWVAVRVRDT